MNTVIASTKKEFVTNVSIWDAFVSTSDGFQEPFKKAARDSIPADKIDAAIALTIVDIVCSELSVERERVLNILEMMADDALRPFLTGLVFWLEGGGHSHEQ